GKVRGWAEASGFLVLDDPAETIDSLLSRATLTANQGDRKVLTISLLSEVLRRDPARVEVWSLLGKSAEELAASSRPQENGRAPLSVSLAASWNVRLVESPKGK